MDKTLEDISQAIQNVEVDPTLPMVVSRRHLEEIRSAILYLTAAVMNCLAVLIKYLNHSGSLSVFSA